MTKEPDSRIVLGKRLANAGGLVRRIVVRNKNLDTRITLPLHRTHGPNEAPKAIVRRNRNGNERIFLCKEHQNEGVLSPEEDRSGNSPKASSVSVSSQVRLLSL